MNIIFRVNAGVFNGLGHLIRCMALAKEFTDFDVKCVFICNKENGFPSGMIDGLGFDVFYIDESISLNEDAQFTVDLVEALFCEVVIVDSYLIGSDWETKVKHQVSKLVVIDDLPNRVHDCHILIDQNFRLTYDFLYSDLLPKNARKLLGPSFAMLRPEFVIERIKGCVAKKNINRVFVFFSGGDDAGETLKAINGLKDWVNDFNVAIDVDVVIGESNSDKKKIEEMCITNSWNLHCNVSNICELMYLSDIAIGSGGSNSWERCCLGIPAIVSILASNQEELINNLSIYGVVYSLGWASKLTSNDYYTALENFDNDIVEKMSNLALNLVDGLGAMRCCRSILDIEER
ncbi:UDP-2,4-diacetamido-2,4,6-trideoxy-beta-L-altropyranose hydrolase [Deefgea piscis]|uniref:UDP-2,4-diacetamido-2,4, 6-trideoxy-beta-L-altropyranose hydrolase n=1 Tax=Deefgea piscis TaxID=2739061 RepID=A0A6M8SZC5_9NEIS|nr:UDP-2,4-diacetamido-2,4,6-trideoxy-beta-L-altropyranose hydrolase [Deefgea piscis]QKJ67899.1 UDP-2,4-diacetamido-2,4,6-trideoxy-beta-L-altropyranose hydrolase [Deefgea piscis]